MAPYEPSDREEEYFLKLNQEKIKNCALILIGKGKEKPNRSVRRLPG